MMNVPHSQIRYLFNQKRELEIHVNELEQKNAMLERKILAYRRKINKLLKDIDRILGEPQIEQHEMEDK